MNRARQENLPKETHPYVLISTGTYLTEHQASEFWPDAIRLRED